MIENTSEKECTEAANAEALNNADMKKPLLRRTIEDFDDNWFTFFSGMLANIPISLLFMFQKWGENTIAHWFYILHIVTFVTSLVLVAIGFIFTIKKINVGKELGKIETSKIIQQERRIEEMYGQWARYYKKESDEKKKTIRIEIEAKTQNEIEKEKNSVFEKTLPEFRVLSIAFWVVFVTVLSTIVALWTLYFFI